MLSPNSPVNPSWFLESERQAPLASGLNDWINPTPSMAAESRPWIAAFVSGCANIQCPVHQETWTLVCAFFVKQIDFNLMFPLFPSSSRACQGTWSARPGRWMGIRRSILPASWGMRFRIRYLGLHCSCRLSVKHFTRPPPPPPPPLYPFTILRYLYLNTSDFYFFFSFLLPLIAFTTFTFTIPIPIRETLLQASGTHWSSTFLWKHSTRTSTVSHQRSFQTTPPQLPQP